MISFIEGDLIECQLNLADVQIGGMGYEVHIPLTTSEKLPALGKEIKLYTHATYREDSQTLYGFFDRESRDFFRMIAHSFASLLCTNGAKNVKLLLTFQICCHVLLV